MVSDLSLLEDKLSDGTDFRILEAPSEWTVSMRDAKTFEIETDKDLVRNIAEQELKNKRISINGYVFFFLVTHRRPSRSEVERRLPRFLKCEI